MRPLDNCSPFTTIWTICREWTALRCRCCRRCGSNGQAGDIPASRPVAAVRSTVRSVPSSMYKDASCATRSPDDIDAIIRSNLAQGIDHFFITDDNFAGNRNWEAIFDRLIKLREEDGLFFRVLIQIDTLCHKISKAARAGVKRVFLGLENINSGGLGGQRSGRTGFPNIATCCWSGRSSAVSPALDTFLDSRPTRRRPSFATSRSSNASCQSIPFPLRLRHQRMCGGDLHACAHRARHLAHGAHRGFGQARPARMPLH
jgi:hypothetical protein